MLIFEPPPSISIVESDMRIAEIFQERKTTKTSALRLLSLGVELYVVTRTLNKEK